MSIRGEALELRHLLSINYLMKLFSLFVLFCFVFCFFVRQSFYVAFIRESHLLESTFFFHGGVI